VAITSKFYTGSVDHVEWAKAAGEVGSTFYGAESLSAWQPTVVSGVDRTVRIGTGVIWGRGVRDTNDATVDVAIPSTTSSGGRWDLIVARRTWGTSATTIVRVAGTSTKGIPAGRLSGPGVVDDQPLALVKVSKDSTLITELVDLRVFGGGTGSLQALDKLALQYLNFPGALVQVGTEFWAYPADGSAWVKAGNFLGLDLFGVGAALQGSGSSPFQFQGGSVVQNTDANGFARLTFPKSFPNGLLTVVAINGDDFAVPRAFPSGAGGPAFGMGGRNWWTYRLLQADGDAYKNRTHRINWLAIGF